MSRHTECDHGAGYDLTSVPSLSVDRDFYSAIAETADRPGQRQLVESLEVPIRSAKAWKVPAGHVCRLIAPEGRQVGDLNVWHLHNPQERFWASRTRQMQGSHISTFDRLWSCLPHLRPLLTFTADSLADYDVDSDGARVHDLLGTRCDPYVNKMLSGVDFDRHCHSNLTRAILPYRLTEYDVHDVLNIFQATGLNKNGFYFMKPSPARPGEYLEFFAEMDLLCALSTCPYGDLSLLKWGDVESAEVEATCHPLAVQVYAIKDDSLLARWKSPKYTTYRGLHGLSD